MLVKCNQMPIDSGSYLPCLAEASHGHTSTRTYQVGQRGRETLRIKSDSIYTETDISQIFVLMSTSKNTIPPHPRNLEEFKHKMNRCCIKLNVNID